MITNITSAGEHSEASGAKRAFRILLPQDGSDCARAALADLSRAGLPQDNVEAHVLTVSEYVYPFAVGVEPGYTYAFSAWSMEQVREVATLAIERAREDAAEAAATVRSMFPSWTVTCEARNGSPASEILACAAEQKSDLIVIGSHGRGRLARAVMGSVSLRLVSEAPCSVRVVKMASPDVPVADAIQEPILLLAFDGSPGSRKAVQALTHRVWPKETVVYILAVADSTLLSGLDYLSIPKDEVWRLDDLSESKLEHVLLSVKHELEHHFSAAVSELVIGSPTRAILSKAEALHASTIFLGASGFSKLERLILGSVAHGVAAKSECTVEIVR